MRSALPATSRGGSMFSTRTSQRRPRDFACRKLATAATSEPKCRSPVGEGANRPTGSFTSGWLPYCAMTWDDSLRNAPEINFTPHCQSTARLAVSATSSAMTCIPFGLAASTILLMASCFFESEIRS